MTIQEAKTLFKTFAEEQKSIKIKPIFTTGYNHSQCICLECGHQWDTHTSDIVCSKCGNNQTYKSMYGFSRNFYFIEKEIQGVLFWTMHSISGDYHNLRGASTIDDIVLRHRVVGGGFILDNLITLACVNYDKVSFLRYGNKFMSEYYNQKQYIKSQKLRTAFLAANFYQSQKKEKKSDSLSLPNINEYKDIILSAPMIEQKHTTNDAFIIQRVFKGTCSYCKKEFTWDSYQVMVTCPHCHTMLDTTIIDNEYRWIGVFDKFDGDVILRLAQVKSSNDGIKIKDSGAILFTKSKMTGLNRPRGRLEIVFPQSKEDLHKIFQGTSLEYSGWLEYKETRLSLDYIKTWYSNKNIEQVLKAGFPKLVCSMVISNNAKEILKPGRKLHEILGVPNRALAPMRELDVSAFKLLAIRKLCKEIPEATADEILFFGTYFETEATINKVIDIHKTYGLSLRQIMQYCNRVYMHQCIDVYNCINIWSDYLAMATACKYSLKKNDKLYPSSLKKEHDIVMFAYAAIKSEIEKEAFEKTANSNAYLEYEYKNYVAIIPKTPEDIIDEATQQRNCVRSYIQSIINGSCSIVFIRKKESPNVSLVTCEIRNQEIVQMKGPGNSNPWFDGMREFVNKWTKAKQLVLTKC